MQPCYVIPSVFRNRLYQQLIPRPVFDESSSWFLLPFPGILLIGHPHPALRISGSCSSGHYLLQIASSSPPCAIPIGEKSCEQDGCRDQLDDRFETHPLSQVEDAGSYSSSLEGSMPKHAQFYHRNRPAARTIWTNSSRDHPGCPRIKPGGGSCSSPHVGQSLFICGRHSWSKPTPWHSQRALGSVRRWSNSPGPCRSLALGEPNHHRYYGGIARLDPR